MSTGPDIRKNDDETPLYFSERRRQVAREYVENMTSQGLDLPDVLKGIAEARGVIDELDEPWIVDCVYVAFCHFFPVEVNKSGETDATS